MIFWYSVCHFLSFYDFLSKLPPLSSLLAVLFRFSAPLFHIRQTNSKHFLQNPAFTLSMSSLIELTPAGTRKTGNWQHLAGHFLSFQFHLPEWVDTPLVRLIFNKAVHWKALTEESGEKGGLIVKKWTTLPSLTTPSYHSKMSSSAGYDLHQKLRTKAVRLLKKKDYTQAIQVLYDGSKQLLEQKEQGSGCDLACYMLTVYTQSEVKVNDESRKRVQDLLELAQPDFWRKKVLDQAVKWVEREKRGELGLEGYKCWGKAD